jgi:hypothetical protein
MKFNMNHLQTMVNKGINSLVVIKLALESTAPAAEAAMGGKGFLLGKQEKKQARESIPVTFFWRKSPDFQEEVIFTTGRLTSFREHTIFSVC